LAIRVADHRVGGVTHAAPGAVVLVVLVVLVVVAGGLVVEVRGTAEVVVVSDVAGDEPHADRVTPARAREPSKTVCRTPAVPRRDPRRVPFRPRIPCIRARERSQMGAGRSNAPPGRSSNSYCRRWRRACEVPAHPQLVRRSNRPRT